MTKSLLALSMLACAISGAHAQGLANPSQAATSKPPVDLSAAQVLPEEAKIRYARGSAPLFAQLRDYSINLSSLISSGDETASAQEAENLGVSVSDLEFINSELFKYWAMERADWSANLLTECTPLLRGNSYNNEMARAAIARLDDTDRRRTEIAESLLNGASAKLSPAASAALSERIQSLGEALEYVKIDLVKMIELSQGGNYLSYLADECKSI